MNHVKVIFNPFLPELKIYINDVELAGYSGLIRYVHTPFFVWNGCIFNEIYREVNDSYSLEFQSCRFECEIMEHLAQLHPQCHEINIKQTELEVLLQQRFARLEKIAGRYIEASNIDIRIYSEKQEMVDAVGEILIESGLFEDCEGILTLEQYPTCSINCYCSTDIDNIGSQDGLHIYICDGPVDKDLVKQFKSKNREIFIFDIGLSTEFSRKEDNVYIFSVEAEDLTDKLLEVFEGTCLRKALKEQYDNVLSMADSGKFLFTKEERYCLEELLLIEKCYKIEYPDVIYQGRKVEIQVIELPGGFNNYECQLKCQQHDIADIDGMAVYAKKPGIIEIDVCAMENGLNKGIGTIEIRIDNQTLITELLLFPKNVFISTGMEKRLELSYKPDNAENVKEIQYESSNPQVATVKPDGTIVGVIAGKCEVTAYTEETTCTVQVEVQPAIEDIILPSTLLELTVGDRLEFKYSLIPENCYERELIKVFNSNTGVVDYNSGYITAKSKGTSTLSIYTPDESIKRSCIIKVKKKGLFG